VTYPQAGAVCPKCGSSAAVHTVAEWASMAQGQMGRMWPGSGPPQPGYQAGQAPQPGYQAGQPPGYGQAQQPGYPAGSVPQSGFPDPSQYQQSGFPDPSQYQQSGFPDPSQYQQSGLPDPSHYQQPGSPDPSHYQQSGSPDPSQHHESGSAGPAQEQSAPPPGHAPQPSQQPGYYSVPQSGYQGQPWQSQPPPRPRRLIGPESGGSDTFEGAIADAVLGAATKAIGGAIGRRMRRAFEEKVVPAMAARQESVMRDRMTIAERHPDLRACLNDQVVFLAGGTRTMPLAQAMAVRTPEQSDALVAQLRG
jgi:hypothetical protein